jgi:hypothetical protein
MNYISAMRGGKRPNSGRKPVVDKAVMITLYPKSSHVEALGGREAVQVLCKEFIEKSVKKKKK